MLMVHLVNRKLWPVYQFTINTCKGLHIKVVNSTLTPTSSGDSGSVRIGCSKYESWCKLITLAHLLVVTREFDFFPHVLRAVSSLDRLNKEEDFAWGHKR